MIRYTFLFLLVTAAALPLWGEVYLLRPADGRSSALSGAGELTLFRQDMTVNGVALHLDVARSPLPWEVMIAEARRSGRFDVTGDTARLIRRLPSGEVERLLFVGVPGARSTVIFRLTTPEKMPVAPPEWPSELPNLPSGAMPVKVIRFSGGAIYGSFALPGCDPVAELRELADRLTLSDWQALGDEGTPGADGNGDIFINRRSGLLLWGAFNREGGVFRVKKL